MANGPARRSHHSSREATPEHPGWHVGEMDRHGVFAAVHRPSAAGTDAGTQPSPKPLSHTAGGLPSFTGDMIRPLLRGCHARGPEPSLVAPNTLARYPHRCRGAPAHGVASSHARRSISRTIHLPNSTNSSSPQRRIKAIPPVITPDKIPEAFARVPVIAERNAS
jgi:hypothetical protein